MSKTSGGEQGGESTRWQPGQSGNPKGRPKGSRNRLTRACSELLAADAEAIMARVIRDAKRGDPVATKLCVERLLSARAARDRWVEIEVASVKTAGDLVAAAAAVIERASAGDISLSEAKEFMGLIDSQRRAIETSDLAARIEALELPASGNLRIVGGDAERRELVARVRREIDERRVEL